MDDRTIERIKKGIKNPDTGPETIALMPSRTCNLRCFYCRGGRFVRSPQENENASGELSKQDLSNLLLDAKGLGVKEINLGGMIGEPFCSKNILWLIAKIKEMGFVGSMTTNGFALGRKTADLLNKCKWDILLLSLDSSEKRIQQTLRPSFNGEDYFERVIEFLERLDSLRSKVRVLLNVVISKINYRKFPELMNLANNYRCIESVNVLRLLNVGLPNYELLQLGPDELNEFRNILSRFKNDKKIRYLSDWMGQEVPGAGQAAVRKRRASASQGNRAEACFTNYYILSIDANGDIIKCPQHWVKVPGINIKSVPLNKLWKEEHLLFRKALAKKADCFNGCCTILKEQNRLIRGKLSVKEKR